MLGDSIRGSITGGERDGKIAEGLQHGNSPSEYPRSFIEGRVLVLTTTNGTRLLHMVHGAAHIAMGAFLNLDALCGFLLESNCNVLLACASWKDKFNLEDTLFAGAVVSKIGKYFDINCDSARMARHLYLKTEGGDILDFLRDSAHFLRLSTFGLMSDMEYCTRFNLHPVVPVLKGEMIVAHNSEAINLVMSANTSLFGVVWTLLRWKFKSKTIWVPMIFLVIHAIDVNLVVRD
jgi:2-phosphosulfolactate phosphatase